MLGLIVTLASGVVLGLAVALVALKPTFSCAANALKKRAHKKTSYTGNRIPVKSQVCQIDNLKEVAIAVEVEGEGTEGGRDPS